MPPPGTTPHQIQDQGARRSAGLLWAPFGDGALVYDTVTATTHHLGALASGLLAEEGSLPVAEAVDLLIEATGHDRYAAQRQVDDAVGVLRAAGLVDRATGPKPPRTWDVPAPTSPSTWAVGRTHAVVDHRVAFHGPDAALIGAVDDLLGHSDDGRPATTRFALEPRPHGQIHLTAHTTWHYADQAMLLEQLPVALNLFASESAAPVVLHAGAVRTPAGKVVAVTGTSGAGKSTLIAALVGAGCDYLGDESIGVRPRTLSPVGYPKPLTLDRNSQQIAGLTYSGSVHRRAIELRPDARCITLADDPIDLVLLVTYDPDKPPSTRRLDPAEAVKALLANTLNLVRSGEVGLGTLCALAARVPLVHVTHADARALASAIAIDPTSVMHDAT